MDRPTARNRAERTGFHERQNSILSSTNLAPDITARISLRTLRRAGHYIYARTPEYWNPPWCAIECPCVGAVEPSPVRRVPPVADMFAAFDAMP